MKMLRSLIALVALCALTPAAFAYGTWSNVTVSKITACSANTGAPCSNNNAGYVQITFSAAETGYPGCAASPRTSGELDISTPQGAAVFQLLQMAKNLGSTISVYGTGQCTILTNTENIGEVVF
jgi:hypothetical protein